MQILTHRCNLKCSYCYEHKTKKSIARESDVKEYIKREVEKAEKEGYTEFEVHFMGGEPMMQFPTIRNVSEWLWKNTWQIPLRQIFVPTNGTLMTDEKKNWFVINREKICLGLSFDGNDFMQNANRSDSARFIDLSFFSSIWPSQSVKMTISPHTIEQLSDGIRYLYDMGFQYVVADLAMGKDIGWQTKHLTILNDELQKLISFHLVHPEVHITSLLNINLHGLISWPKNKKHCFCGENLICIETDGRVYPCHIFAPITAGEKRAKESIMQYDFHDRAAFTPIACSMCDLEPICIICPGINFVSFDSIQQQSSFHCQAFKIQFLNACQLQYQLAKMKNDTREMNYIDNIINTYNYE